MNAAKWKLLTLGLAAVVGVLVLVPSVQASTPDLLQQILTAVGAIQAKTDNLPADPAAKSDVTAASSALSAQVAALPVSGALRRRTIGLVNDCVVVSGPIASGRERAVTISVHTTNIDADVLVEIDNGGPGLSSYVLGMKAKVPSTFVESQTAGEVLKVCNVTPDALIVISAIWSEFPTT